MRICIIGLVFLILFPIVLAVEIDGNKVFINHTKFYLSADPHSITSDTDVIFELDNKDFQGNINIILGSNTNELYFTNPMVYSPHNFTDIFNTTISVDNITSMFPSTQPCTIGEEFSGFKYNVSVVNPQSSWNDVYCFNSFNKIDDDTYEIDLSFVHWDYKEWSPLNKEFNKVVKEFDGKNMWWYMTNIPIQANTTYKLKVRANVPVKLGRIEGKYDFMIYPSTYGTQLHQANIDGKLFLLDPWFNASWMNRYELPVTWMGSRNWWALNVSVDSATLISGSDLQADCDDFRVVCDNGSNIVPYWIVEDTCNSGDTMIFFNVTEVCVPYLYFNNSAATSGVDGAGTGYVFDEHEDNSINTAIWDELDSPGLIQEAGSDYIQLIRTGAGSSYFAKVVSDISFDEKISCINKIYMADHLNGEGGEFTSFNPKQQFSASGALATYAGGCGWSDDTTQGRCVAAENDGSFSAGGQIPFPKSSWKPIQVFTNTTHVTVEEDGSFQSHGINSNHYTHPAGYIAQDGGEDSSYDYDVRYDYTFCFPWYNDMPNASLGSIEYYVATTTTTTTTTSTTSTTLCPTDGSDWVINATANWELTGYACVVGNITNTGTGTILINNTNVTYETKQTTGLSILNYPPYRWWGAG